MSIDTIIPWHYNFDGAWGDELATDHDLRAAFGLVLDEIMDGDSSDKLKKIRLEFRLSERVGDLRWARLQHRVSIGRESNIPSAMGRAARLEELIAVYLGIDASDPLIHSVCEEDWANVLRDVVTVGVVYADDSDHQEIVNKKMAEAIPRHVSLTAKYSDMATHEHVGIASDPPWDGVLVVDKKRWFSESFLAAGLTILQRKTDNPSAQDCVVIENKHPTKALALKQQVENGSKVTISAGNKSALSEFSCSQGDWKIEFVEPEPKPINPAPSDKPGDGSPDAG